MKKVWGFLKKEPMLTVSVLAAVAALFITPPSWELLSDIDWRTLGTLFMMLTVLEGFKKENIFRPLLRLAGNIRTMVGLSLFLVFSVFFSSMFVYDHLKENDKYPVFIDGNHALTEITNKNAKGGTLLVIKDSFSHCMAPFLAENYSKVVLVDMRYYKLPVSEIVKTINPERVLVLYGIDNLTTDTDLVWLE